MRLVETRIGRIKFHAYMITQDHKLAWHLKGIVREITKY